jgi:hypothetical protein
MHLAAPQFEAPVKQNFPLLLLHRRRVMGQPGACACWALRAARGCWRVLHVHYNVSVSALLLVCCRHQGVPRQQQPARAHLGRGLAARAGGGRGQVVTPQYRRRRHRTARQTKPRGATQTLLSYECVPQSFGRLVKQQATVSNKQTVVRRSSRSLRRQRTHPLPSSTTARHNAQQPAIQRPQMVRPVAGHRKAHTRRHARHSLEVRPTHASQLRAAPSFPPAALLLPAARPTPGCAWAAYACLRTRRTCRCVCARARVVLQRVCLRSRQQRRVCGNRVR